MLLAKASGMRRRAGRVPVCVAMLTTMGIMSATVPVFETKAPMPAVTSTTSRNRRRSLPPASFIIFWLTALANPVWNMAPPTTNSPAIIMTTVDEKPENASSGVSIPKKSNAERAHSATMSERTLPAMNITMVMNRMISVVVMSCCVVLRVGLAAVVCRRLML